MKYDTITVAVETTATDGIILFILLLKNDNKLNRFSAIGFNIIPVIKYPDITKKTSTPTKPPLNTDIFRWYAKTSSTAMALSPSISARYFIIINTIPLILQTIIFYQLR